jgi:predicted negative regulator of RcsB-dependent stress response
MLERSVGIDASYAPAWEALGRRYYYDYAYGDGGEQMLRHSDSAFERAQALDPNFIDATAQLIINRTDRGEIGDAYAEGSALVKRRPESARAHFAFAYVLRYVGLLDESAHECDTALAMDRGDFQLRSCALTFMQLGKLQRAMEFVHLDAGSEWAARQTAVIFLGQGKLSEARQSIQRMSDNPRMGRDLIQACLDPQRKSELEASAQKVQDAVLKIIDSEPRYNMGALLSYCGQKGSALRLLKSAVEHNYCACSALQSDPLLVKLRGSPEFSELLSAAKQCQDRALAQRDQSPH